jgi:SSS family solute:Na+ symporter
MMLTSLDVVVLVMYLGGMLYIGARLAGRQKTREDYFLAGRNMPWLAVAMSMYASLTSATTYLALPATAYSQNISLVVVCVISPLLVPVLVTVFYPMYRRMNVTTSYEYIAARFGRPARFAVSLLFCLARLGWLGIVVYAPALAFSTVTGVDVRLAMLGMGALATVYTVLGGLSAVIWTDVAQFIIMLAGAVWLAVALAGEAPGGVAEILEVAGEAGRLSIFPFDLSLAHATGWSVGLSFYLSMMQDYGADQVTVQRLQSTPTYRGMVRASIFNAGTDFFVVALLLFIGLGIFAGEQRAPDPGLADLRPDQILPFYVMRHLPAGISGLVLTAIFAAAMSSMDSGINSVATVISKDFLEPLGRAGRDEEKDVRRARGLTLLLGALATGIAFYAARRANIIETFITFVSLFSAPVLALFLLGLLTRRARFAGWLAGTAAAIAATWWVQHHTKVNWSYHFPLSFAISFGVGYLASRVGRSEPVAAELTLRGSRRASS